MKGKQFLFLLSILFFSCSGIDPAKRIADSLANIPEIKIPTAPVSPNTFSIHPQWISASPYFKSLIQNFRIDSCGEFLLISFSHVKQDSFPLPSSETFLSAVKDTLYQTQFFIQLFAGESEIQVPAFLYSYNQSNPDQDDSFENGGNQKKLDSLFVLKSLYENMRDAGFVQFKIPYYAFCNLKKGLQKIKMVFYQDTFRSVAYNDHDVERRKSNQRLIEASAVFNLNIPPIYHSEIVFDSLLFKQDVSNSDIGINSNKDLPDIYWKLYCPEDYYQVESLVFFNTMQPHPHKKVSLGCYHLSLNDSIDIEILDYDYLSGDDDLGNLYLPLFEIPSDREKAFGSSSIQQFLLRRETVLVN